MARRRRTTPILPFGPWWQWDPVVCGQAATWISDHLPQEKNKFAHWEKQILSGNRLVFQTISLGALRSRAETPLVDALAAALENRFPIWRFDIVRCSIFNLDFLLTDEVEKWALESAAKVVKRRIEGVLS